MPDLSFFDTITSVWSLFFGFFPGWFQAIVAASLGLMIAGLGIKLAKLLKDLFWPF